MTPLPCDRVPFAAEYRRGAGAPSVTWLTFRDRSSPSVATERVLGLCVSLSLTEHAHFAARRPFAKVGYSPRHRLRGNCDGGTHSYRAAQRNRIALVRRLAVHDRVSPAVLLERTARPHRLAVVRRKSRCGADETVAARASPLRCRRNVTAHQSCVGPAPPAHEEWSTSPCARRPASRIPRRYAPAAWALGYSTRRAA